MQVQWIRHSEYHAYQHFRKHTSYFSFTNKDARNIPVLAFVENLLLAVPCQADQGQESSPLLRPEWRPVLRGNTLWDSWCLFKNVLSIWVGKTLKLSQFLSPLQFRYQGCVYPLSYPVRRCSVVQFTVKKGSESSKRLLAGFLRRVGVFVVQQVLTNSEAGAERNTATLRSCVLLKRMWRSADILYKDLAPELNPRWVYFSGRCTRRSH